MTTTNFSNTNHQQLPSIDHWKPTVNRHTKLILSYLSDHNITQEPIKDLAISITDNQPITNKNGHPKYLSELPLRRVIKEMILANSSTWLMNWIDLSYQLLSYKPYQLLFSPSQPSTNNRPFKANNPNPFLSASSNNTTPTPTHPQPKTNIGQRKAITKQFLEQEQFGDIEVYMEITEPDNPHLSDLTFLHAINEHRPPSEEH